MIETRSDGRETGTWYAGHRSKAKLTLRAYDKAYQLACMFGETIPPTTRVEVTARKGVGATLRDAAIPEAIFWHAASPSVLTAPEGTPVWKPDQGMCWTTIAPVFDPAALLRRRVTSLDDIDALALLADDLGPKGRDYLLHLLQQRLDNAPRETEASSATG
jgi:hypothetical protein